MTSEESVIEGTSSPRFEFRSFGRDFTPVAERMAALTEPVPDAIRERRSSEIYIVSRANNLNNTKIRAGKMDIKTLLRTVDGLEQWEPLLKAEFPISLRLLEESVFPAFQVEAPVLEQSDCSLEAFLATVEAQGELRAVRVDKRRFGYRVNETICEFAQLVVAGLELVTVATESTEIGDIKKTLIDLELAGLENINYLQAIKRVIGMIDQPLAN